MFTATILICAAATFSDCDRHNALSVLATSYERQTTMWACLAGGMMGAAGLEAARDLPEGQTIKVVCRQ